MYTGAEKFVLVCVINSSQLTELTKLVAQFPGSFVTVSEVTSVMGNFKRLDSNNQPEKQIYDSGKPVKK